MVTSFGGKKMSNESFAGPVLPDGTVVAAPQNPALKRVLSHRRREECRDDGSSASAAQSSPNGDDAVAAVEV